MIKLNKITMIIKITMQLKKSTHTMMDPQERLTPTPHGLQSHTMPSLSPTVVSVTLRCTIEDTRMTTITENTTTDNSWRQTLKDILIKHTEESKEDLKWEPLTWTITKITMIIQSLIWTNLIEMVIKHPGDQKCHIRDSISESKQMVL